MNMSNRNKYDYLSKCRIEGDKYFIYNSKIDYEVDYETFKNFLEYNKPVKINQIVSFVQNYNIFCYNSDFDTSIITYNDEDVYNIKKSNLKITETKDYRKIYYDIDIDNNCGYIILQINKDKKYKFCLDIDIMLYFYNNNAHIPNDIRFKEQSIYPYLKIHKTTSKLDDIAYYKIINTPLKTNNLNLYFENGNIYDLRRTNISYKHSYHKTILKTYPNAIYFEGHYKKTGKDAYIMKNPMWKIDDDLFIIYCEHDNLCMVDKESIKRIEVYEEKHKKITIFKNENNYYLTSNNLFIHQIIMDCYGNGKGTKKISVDHIDQNPENNCYSNLRIADRKTQEQNTKGIKPGTKRERKQNATSLPDGITQDMLPKYVVYYNRCYNKEKQLYREFFEINSHPKQNGKYISSSKSNKVSIFEKLEDIKQKLLSLDCDTYDTNYIIPDKYPKGVYIKEIRGSNHFVFDLRTEDLRYNLKMKIKQDVDETKEFERFREKIKTKYPTLEI